MNGFPLGVVRKMMQLCLFHRTMVRQDFTPKKAMIRRRPMSSSSDRFTGLPFSPSAGRDRKESAPAIVLLTVLPTALSARIRASHRNSSVILV